MTMYNGQTKNEYNTMVIEAVEEKKMQIYQMHEKTEKLETWFFNEKEYYIEYLPEERFDEVGEMLEEVALKLADAMDALLDATTIIEETLEK